MHEGTVVVKSVKSWRRMSYLPGYLLSSRESTKSNSMRATVAARSKHVPLDHVPPKGLSTT